MIEKKQQKQKKTGVLTYNFLCKKHVHIHATSTPKKIITKHFFLCVHGLTTSLIIIHFSVYPWLDNFISNNTFFLCVHGLTTSLVTKHFLCVYGLTTSLVTKHFLCPWLDNLISNKTFSPCVHRLATSLVTKHFTFDCCCSVQKVR